MKPHTWGFTSEDIKPQTWGYSKKPLTLIGNSKAIWADLSFDFLRAGSSVFTSVVKISASVGLVKASAGSAAAASAASASAAAASAAAASAAAVSAASAAAASAARSASASARSLASWSDAFAQMPPAMHAHVRDD